MTSSTRTGKNRRAVPAGMLLLLLGVLAIFGAIVLPSRVPSLPVGPTRAVSSSGAGGAAVPSVVTSPAGRVEIGLSEVKDDDPADAEAPAPLASSTPLSPTKVEAILAGLPPMPSRPPSLRTAGPGRGSAGRPTALAVAQPFPATGIPGRTRKGVTPNPAASSPTAPPAPVASPRARPLRIVRHSPEGAVREARSLVIAFNQPMVELSTVGHVASSDIPVRLSPEPKGEWKWLDPRTLTFTPAARRLPMATRYEVEVPRGVRSALGCALQTRKQWTFTTLPPRLLEISPTGTGADLQPLITLRFDQDVDAIEVARHVHLVAGGTDFPLSLNVGPWHWSHGDTVYLLPARPLPLATHAQLTLDAGTPSAEGPLTTRCDQVSHFWTHGPLEFVDSKKLQELRQHLDPTEDLKLGFKPSLDDDALEKHVTVSPAVGDLSVRAWSNTLHLSGSFQPNTSYVATIDGALTDTFGQTLGKRLHIAFHTTAPRPHDCPSLRSVNGVIALIDPRRPPRLEVCSVNVRSLRVSLYRVCPGDWQAFREARDWAETDQAARSGHLTMPAIARPPMPGTLCSTTIMPVAMYNYDREVATSIDLAPALRGGMGHVVALVEPDRWMGPISPPRVVTWCQATAIRLEVASDMTRAAILATSAVSGTCLPGVTVQLCTATGARVSAITGPDGLARLRLPRTLSADCEQLSVQATKGADQYFEPEVRLVATSPAACLQWHVLSDRGVYRPGDVVHVKGWVRARADRPGSEPRALEGRLAQVSYKLRDSDGTLLKKGNMRLGPLDSFRTGFRLPQRMKLGGATVEVNARGRLERVSNGSFSLQLKVEEYRAPEFEVKAAKTGPGPFFASERADVSARASYLAGGSVAGARIKWHVTATPAGFVPARWDAYCFDGGKPEKIADEGWTLEGRTRTTGRHRLRLDFGGYAPRGSLRVSVESTVTDANRRSWSDTESLLVHPSSVLVGLKASRPFAEVGEPLAIDTIVTDVDGHPVAGRTVELEVSRIEWQKPEGSSEWREVQVPVTRQSLQSTAAPVQVALPVPVSGQYRILATVMDDRGRSHQSEVEVAVAGGTAQPGHGKGRRRLELALDRAEYQPGEVARLLVRSPIWPAEALLEVRRNGIVHVRSVHLASPTSVLRIPVTEPLIGGAQVILTVVGLGEVKDLDSRSTASSSTPRGLLSIGAETMMEVSARSRRLTLDVTPAKNIVAPGDATSVILAVKDPSGNPAVGADVTLAVVDESALVLSGYSLYDPVATFYPTLAGYPYGRAASFGKPVYNHVVALGGGPLSRVTGESGRTLGLRYTLSYALDPNTARLVAGIGSTSDVRPIMPSIYGATSMPYLGPTFANGRPWTNGQGFSGKGNVGVRTGPEERLSLPGNHALQAALQRSPATRSLRLRSNFNPVAVFAASVRTDSKGRATVRFRLPDNLTRYRVMAVAAAGERLFGKGESTLIARLPLMARPSPPRFLNTGDRFELPVLLQNQTRQPLKVDVAVRAQNAHLLEQAPQDANPASGAATHPSISSGSQVKGASSERPLPATSLPSGAGVPSASGVPSAAGVPSASGVPPEAGKPVQRAGIPTVTEEQSVTSTAGRHVTVPAQGRVEVRFPAAPAGTGTALFQVATVSGRNTDSAQVSVPVHVPATMETFASYGVLDGSALLQPLHVARDVLPGFGGLEITATSTQFQALTDALLYVQGYPFECNEQLASRVLSVAALRDMWTAFDAPGLPGPAEMSAGVSQCITLMARRQHADGGFGYWDATEGRSDPFVTVHVAHALQRAREKGFAIPRTTLDQVRVKLRTIDRHLPAWYSASSRQTLVAYALYVRNRLGDRVAKRARRLITAAGLENLTPEAVAWLLPILSRVPASRALARDMVVTLTNNVTETTSEAHYAASTDDWLLCSPPRADAVVLDALLTVDPGHDLIPKLVRGLSNCQEQGRWATTQENAFVLLALGHYFERIEKAPPDFVARFWVGDRYAGERAFRGRTNARFSLHVPMARLLASVAGSPSPTSPPAAAIRKSRPVNSSSTSRPASDSRRPSPVSITIGKQGRGRLYYRMAMRSAPSAFHVGPTHHGFEVERRYEAVENKDDVQQDAVGTWHLRAGAPVRIRIRMVTRAERHHVALVDPLPAGLEIVNPALAGSESIAVNPAGVPRKDYWKHVSAYGWFDHQDLRDDRAQAFTLTLLEGTFEYAYIARATTPGVFIAPPTKVEEMYHPETFGRGPTDRVVIQ